MAFQLDVTSYRNVHRRTLRISFGTALFIGTIGAVLIGSLVTDQMGRPTPPSFAIATILYSLAAVFFAIPVLMVATLSRNLRRAIAREQGKTLWLVADDRGMRIPLLILTEPGFSRLLLAGESELWLSWNEITAWVVRGAVAERQPEHLLSIQSEAPLLQGMKHVGIFREALGSREAEWLVYVKEHLAAKLEHEKKGWLSAG